MIPCVECAHFGVCGGCRCEPDASGRAKPLPYDLELARKEASVRGLLAAYDVQEWLPIVAAPDPWHYRNKMECAFGVWDDRLVLGLRAAGRFDRVVNLETCILMSPECLEVLKRVRQWAWDNGLTGYHRRRHDGNLRYLVLREGKTTGQRMGILIANTSIPSPLVGEGVDGGTRRNLPPTSILPYERGGGLWEDLRTRIQSLLSTCWLGVTDEKSDVARADDMRLLWGPGTIEERLGTVTYRISPYSFFQTNTRGTEKLYALLHEWAAPHPSPSPASGRGDLTTGSLSLLGRGPGEGGGEGGLIDLYCGSGGIALALASFFDRVIGIDTNCDAIEDAKKNAEFNGIQNAEFVCEDVQEFLRKLPGSKLSVQLSAMVVDPPRAGLHPKALQALVEINPPRLAYVSCNPESLARDLKSLVPLYRIRSVQPVDLFPHTAHVETLAILEHR